MLSRRTVGLGVAATGLAGFGAVPARRAAAQPATLLDIVRTSPRMSRVNALVEAAALRETLAAPGRFTLFVPHDPYFEILTAPPMDQLMRDRDRLRRLLMGHIATEAIRVELGSRSGHNGGEEVVLVPTLAGGSLRVTRLSMLPRVERRIVVVPNIIAGNGVVHCIDGLIGGW